MFTNPNRRNTGPARTLAAILAVALVITAVVPPLALAESDQEGEGTAPPGALPGLEPGEPGGPETTLEEVAPAPEEGEVEEVAPPVSVESEPPPPVVTGAAPPVEAAPPAAPTPAAAQPQPEPAAPVYGTEPETPIYEPSPAPAPAEPVRNEAIIAPSGPPSAASAHSDDHAGADVPEASPPPVESPVPVTAPSEAPEPIAATPVPASEPADQGGELQGRAHYTVAPGDCLWSIATAILPPGSSDAEVAAEVARLWRMNAARIGTGDPDVILAGTVLRLG
jgi:LysM domain